MSLVCALLARFPELASIRALPAEGTVRLTFALRQRLDRRRQHTTSDAVQDHVNAFVLLEHASPEVVEVEFESERTMSFVHIVRDLETFSKDELEMLCALLRTRFGDRLVCSERDESADEDEFMEDEAALYAVECLRDPAQSKSLVGFREEKRVLVYFLKSRKKAKASARR
ncbi:MAG: hypothetical protein ACREMP_10900 [Candidatus Tyrphobacter sp.]